MSTYFLGSFFQFFVNRIFVFSHQCFFYIFRYRTVCVQLFVIRQIIRVYLCRSQTVFLNRIFAGIAISSNYLVHTAVGTGSHYIVLYQHCFAVLRTDEGCGLVSVLEVFYFFSGRLFNVCRTVHSFGVHSYESFHTVATVNIEYLASRAHTMSCIYITTMFLIVVHTPVVPVIRPEVFQIVYISTFYVKYLTEYTLLCHIE